MSPSEKTVEAFLQGKGRISLSNSSRSSSFSRDQTSLSKCPNPLSEAVFHI